MNIPDFEAWALFVAVAEGGSFAAAARANGVSVPTVSRAVARLEARLGGTLFHRTSRRLSLSALGREALAGAQQLVADAVGLEARLGEARSEPAGRIRVAAPLEFGRDHLAPLLPAFLERHPGIAIELMLDDARVDIVASGADLVLRIGHLADSSLIARRLCPVPFQVVASPAGIARFGRPAHPADLGQRPCLVYTNPISAGVWRFRHDDGTQMAVSVDGPLAANSGGALIPALLAGLGIGIYPRFLLGSLPEEGKVEVLLPGWQPVAASLFLITPPGTLRPLRVRRLMDYLAEVLAAG